MATFVSIETATSPNSAISSFSRSSLKNRTKRNPNNLNLFYGGQFPSIINTAEYQNFCFSSPPRRKHGTTHLTESTFVTGRTLVRGATLVTGTNFYRKSLVYPLFQPPVVQTLDSAIQRISTRRNNWVYIGWIVIYPVSMSGWRYPPFERLVRGESGARLSFIQSVTSSSGLVPRRSPPC